MSRARPFAAGALVRGYEFVRVPPRNFGEQVEAMACLLLLDQCRHPAAQHIRDMLLDEAMPVEPWDMDDDLREEVAGVARELHQKALREDPGLALALHLLVYPGAA